MRVDSYGQEPGLIHWYDGQTGEPVPLFNHNHRPDLGVVVGCPACQDTYMAETVDHPQHYGGDTPYEAIKVIEAWNLGFCLGNCVKYVSRAGKKDKARTVEDLKKAVWYLEHEIKNLES